MGIDEFLDEKIIEMINQVEQPTMTVETNNVEKRPEERTIYTGIKISGKWIEFEKRLLVENKIMMMIPKDFTVMEPEKARIKYPSEQRPKVILTDHTGTINFMFSHMDENIADGDAENVRNHLFGIMRRVNPGIKHLATGTEVISGKNVAYVEFSNPAIDGKLYNLMFYLQLEGRILMGSFNCGSKVMKYWKKPAFEMMCSIEVLDKKTDGEECEMNECAL